MKREARASASASANGPGLGCSSRASAKLITVRPREAGDGIAGEKRVRVRINRVALISRVTDESARGLSCYARRFARVASQSREETTLIVVEIEIRRSRNSLVVESPDRFAKKRASFLLFSLEDIGETPRDYSSRVPTRKLYSPLIARQPRALSRFLNRKRRYRAHR